MPQTKLFFFFSKEGNLGNSKKENDFLLLTSGTESNSRVLEVVKRIYTNLSLGKSHLCNKDESGCLELPIKHNVKGNEI